VDADSFIADHVDTNMSRVEVSSDADRSAAYVVPLLV
jgi:hypothetical protein